MSKSGPGQGGEEAGKIGGRLEAVRRMDSDELLISDLIVGLVRAAATAVARIAPLFDVNQRNFERQPLMRKHPCEVRIRQTGRRALPPSTAQPAADNSGRPLRPLDEKSPHNDGFTTVTPMIGQRGLDLCGNPDKAPCWIWIPAAQPTPRRSDSRPTRVRIGHRDFGVERFQVADRSEISIASSPAGLHKGLSVTGRGGGRSFLEGRKGNSNSEARSTRRGGEGGGRGK